MSGERETPRTPAPALRSLLDPALRRLARRRMSRDQCAARTATALPPMQPLEPRLLMAGDVVYALNAGGVDFTDVNGIAWVNDTALTNEAAANSSTTTTSSPIDRNHPSVPAGTDLRLLQSERYDADTGEPMAYRLAVANGNYQVDLYFADTFSGTQGVGERVFDVQLEGATVADDFDIVAAAGSGYKAVVQTFTVAVDDGVLDLTFTHEVENPAIKGVLIRTVDVDPPNLLGPSVDLNGGATAGSSSSATFDGQGPVNVTDPAALLTDEDSTVLASLTVTLDAAPDGANESLAANVTGTGLTSIYSSSTNTLTISGPGSAADYQAVLRTVTYDNAAATPDPATRQLTFIASDGELDSRPETATITIDIAPPDSIAPVVDLNGPGIGTGSTATFIPGEGPVAIAGLEATLTDADSATIQSLIITLTNRPDGVAETLAADLANFPALAQSYVDGVLTISGLASPAEYADVLNLVSYDNAAADPDPAQRTITVVANDGTLLSSPAASAVTIQTTPPDPVAPVLDLNGPAAGVNTTATFVVGDGPVSIVPPAALLTDADSATLNSITVKIDPVPADNLQALAADTTGTPITAAYASGKLTLTGTATVAEFQSVLRTITYDNSAADPDLTPRIITFVASDGVLSSVGASTIVQIQKPVVEAGTAVYALNAGGNSFTDANGIEWIADTPFTNEAAAVSFGFSNGTNLDLTDPSVPDNTAQLLLQSERWDSGGGDEMAYALDVANGNYQVDLYFADIYSGTQSVGARVFDIQLEGVTVLDDYDIFADVGGFTGVVKTFNVEVQDGVLDLEFLHETENPAIKGILVRTLDNVAPDPIAPVLDLDAVAAGTGSTATYITGSGPVNVTALDAALTDADSAALNSLNVFLVNTPDGAAERLDADVTGTGISKSFAGGVLSLTGVASVADFQAVLRTVTYDNLAATPDLAARSINVIANDGTLDSNTAVAIITVEENVQAQPGTLLANVINTLDFNNAQTGVVERITITLTHPGAAIDDPVVVTGTDFTGVNQTDFGDLFASTYGSSVTVNPGESLDLTFYVLPGTTGAKFANVEILHSGTNTLSFNLEANAIDPVAVGFGTGLVAGLDAVTPTTLQWGPDNRLYVGTLDGLIHAYTIQRNGPSDYAVTDTQTITLVQDIPNHEDDGTLNPSVDTRLITGLKVLGTAQAPVIYVTSSDPRLTNGDNSTIDTNSGIVSKLTQNGDGSWDKIDLVRGLPRSAVDHAPHALQLLEDSNTLLVAVGGLTNAGAPGEFFGNLPEYALSAGILSLDLNALEALPTQTDANGQQYKYNLPTLDDEDRATNNDAGDPFGGNEGKNQAVLEQNGPVDIFAGGLRNPYDFVINQYGQIYTTDNGPNATIGDVPLLDENGQPTNEPNDGGSSAQDALHLISNGSYSGHPNPTRANTDNTFNDTDPQSPVYNGYSEPGDYQENGTDGALALFDTSTNGIAEYTATGFDGALNGDLLTVTIDGKLTRLKLSPDGTSVIDREILFNNSGVYPLDLTTVGDDHPFAGTIWVADLFAGPGEAIRVYEPEAGSGQGTPEDLDGDGYLNQDEIDNGTNPESSGDTPSDNDQDFVSDLNDDDDDNDTLLDLTDPFQVDDTNGNNTNAPFTLSFDNDDLNRGGLLDLGFTGVMTNGSTNYRDQFDFANLTAGSAAGVLTIDQVSAGTALGSANNQENAFQFGLNLNETSQPVTIQTKIDSVFDNATPAAGQRAGIYFGTGDQDNYIAVFVEGDGTINTVTEIDGVFTFGTGDIIGTNNFTNLNLYLTVDPTTQTVQAAYSLGTGLIVELAGTTAFPASWLQATTAPAVGVIATNGGGEAYAVTYDFIRVEAAGGNDGQAPFNGTANQVGERVEAEEYDLGGDGVAYLDLSAFNEGSANPRPGELVDFEATSDAGGGLNIGWIEAGEWLEYTFDIDEAGTYSADFRVALESGTGSTFHLEINGQNISGPINLPVTGGWQDWQTVTATDLQLEAGPVVLRVAFDSASTSRFAGNFNWLQLNFEQAADGNPPQVAAGADASLAGPTGSFALNGTVLDDSTNNVPLRTVWNLITGPEAVTFDDPYAFDTNVNFSAPGVYVLRLSADNGIGGIVSDDITVTVPPSVGGLIGAVDLLNDDNSSLLGTLNPSPLAPGDIAWTTILINESQVNNFAGNPDGSTDSTATGTASFFFDASTNELSYSITYAGLSADLSNIHIHGPASAGVSNMAHIFDVFSNEQEVIDSGVNRRSDTVTGVVNLTSHTHGGANPTPTLAEALDALTTGQAYVNVHTTAFPMGEIRGNVPVAVPAAEPFFDLGVLNATTLRFAPVTTSGVDSVMYVLDGTPLDGSNLPQDGATWIGTTGDHTLVVTPYDGANLTGNAGPSTTFQFAVRADPGTTQLAEWEQIANAPFAQFEGQGVEANGKLYVFGGFINGALDVTTQFAAYDPGTDSWASLANAPQPLTHANHVVDGDNIYVLGGYVGDHPGGSTDEVWVYNITTDTWSAGPDLPEDRAGAGAAILGRTLYYYGGATRLQDDVNSTVDHGDLWTLDLGATSATGDDSATWATGLADMPAPRNHMAGVELNGLLYAIGGQTGENEFTGNSDLVHRYDPVADVWTRVADLPIEIGHITASTFTANGRIFVITGVTENSVSTDTIYMYDPATDTWSSLPPAPAKAQSPIAVHLDGKLYVVGGDESPGGITSKAYVLDLDDSWFVLDSAPVALAEVGAGVIGDTLYVVGENNNATLAYDLGTGQWSGANDLAKRPFAGSHHATEVIDGKLYLFGGLGANSVGKVQIYDPAADQWSAGADIPLAVGSATSVLIGGKVYLAGGVLGNDSTDAAFVYDVASDQWSTIATLPREINHAASATDGTKFYIFTGRDGGNQESNGFNTVQIYDPATNTWESSDDLGSPLAPVPEARGGMGRAVYLNGEFYVIGGETKDSPAADANNVYDRVDIYNPATNTWRIGTPMPTARHGIYPVEHAGVIYIAGGGIKAGISSSNLLEAYYVDVT